MTDFSQFAGDAWNGVGAPSADSHIVGATGVFAIFVNKADPANSAWRGQEVFTFPFTSVYGGFSEGGSVNIASRPALMRPEPLSAYIGPSQREVSVVIRLMPQQGGTSFVANGSSDTTAVPSELSPEGIRQQALMLEALSRPMLRADTGRRLRAAPPVVTVQIGAVLRMRALVTACSTRWHELKRSAPSGYELFSAADVSMTFAACSEKFSNYGIGSTSRNGGGL